MNSLTSLGFPLSFPSSSMRISSSQGAAGRSLLCTFTVGKKPKYRHNDRIQLFQANTAEQHTSSSGKNTFHHRFNRKPRSKPRVGYPLVHFACLAIKSVLPQGRPSCQKSFKNCLRAICVGLLGWLHAVIFWILHCGLKYLVFTLKILVKTWLMVHTQKITEKENKCSISQ